MKTDEEVIQRIEERKNDDFFGWEITDLIVTLPFEKARPYMKDDSMKGDWKQDARDRDSVLARMLHYMPFAWEKANNCRGISASRSMSHFMAWTWIVGDDFGDLLDYEHYGKDNLVRICEKYGWDPIQWDDGRRVNSEDEL